MSNVCALCDRKCELKLSHIIPKFVIDWLKTTQPGSLRAGGAPNRRIQDAYKIPLLCGGCESQFSKWETNFCKKVFAPYHRKQSASLVYGPWANKCLVSISWRVVHFIKRQFGIRHFSQTQTYELDKAINSWHRFLSGNEMSIGLYTQHLLPLTIIHEHTIPNLSPFMNRYLIGSVDIDVIRSERMAYAFAKLGQILLFGRIMDENPEHWSGTEVAADSGKIEPGPYSVPAVVMDFLNGRANRAGYLLSTMSKKQKDLVETSLIKNVSEFSKTDLARAMAADVSFSRNQAFEITGSQEPSE